jgi:lysophospholipase L1-like esterase
MLLSLVRPGTAWAEMSIVATGDSQTIEYYPYLEQALADRGIVARTARVAASGLTAMRYAGAVALEGEPTVDYPAQVLDADPDLVLFLLGTNDAWSDTSAESWFVDYTSTVNVVMDRLLTGTNSKGRSPVVLVSTVLPLDLEKNQAFWDTTSNSGALQRIEGWYNPFIKTLADKPNVTVIDNWTAIQQVPDWRSELLSVDGLHLSAAGDQWLAEQFADGLTAVVVPEPAAGTLALALLLAIGWRLRRARRPRVSTP